jgi:NAD(P) transhydrogenase subunit alpha
MDDEVIRGATVIRGGEITWPPPPPKLSVAPPQAKKPAPPAVAAAPARRRSGAATLAIMALGAFGLLGLGQVAPPSFMEHFTVFVLACFVGYQVIWNVTPALHTPLMSVTNAISGIIVIGALLQVSQPEFGLISALAGVSILIASINIAGGFLVTQRMLRMFRR